MKIEIACVNKSSDYNELVELYHKSADPRISTLCIPSSLINRYPELTTYLDICGIVDYPHGLADTSVRVFESLFFAKRGVSKIDLVLNNIHVAEWNLYEIENDAKAVSNVCLEYDIELRIILEYKLFNPHKLRKVCDMLYSLGVKTVVTATGQIADTTVDHAIFGYEVNTISGLDVIMCSRLWSQRHIDVFKNVNPSGFRFISLDSAKTYLNKLDFGV